MSRAELADICRYRTDSTPVDPQTYISTESMLPNRAGIISASSVPSAGKARVFRKGDTLISNIRPYFKKIWQATADGCCSADVLVFEPSNCNPDYLYWLLSDDSFFDYMVATSKGTKMPRGDKAAIMHYEYERMGDDDQAAIAKALNPIRELININQQTNDYLAAMCETLAAAVESDDESVLADIAVQVTEKTECNESSLDSYVSTESLLPDKGGRQQASSLPASGKVTVYQAGDTLVSNIRPYFKKIWLADRGGTCSGDVIVFRAKDPRYAAFLHSTLRSDSFFEHVMAGAKGTKMPRGDKKQMMQYPAALECNQGTLDTLTAMVGQIGANNRENETLASLRDVLLPKLMSGEIDVSQIELPTQPNNHLCG